LYWHQKRHVDKWNRRSRNKSMLLQPSDSWQRCQKYMLEKIQPLPQIVLGKLDSNMYKNISPCRKIS
jgi:hypothetical protein